MRTAGVAGILFVVLSAAVVVLSPFWPPLGTQMPQVVQYYATHRTPFLVGNYLAALAAVPSFVQLAALVGLLKRAEGDRGWLWVAVLSAALFAHALGGGALLAYQAIPFQLDVRQPGSAKALSDLAGSSFGFALIGAGGFAALTSWATFKTRALPGWFGLSGLLVALACFVASAGVVVTTPEWFAGGGTLTVAVTGLFLLWALALAVIFLRQPEPA